MIYKTKTFARFAKRSKLPDASLIDAIERAELGSIDAHLGGGLIRQRVARRGGGRSGGYRTLIALRSGAVAIFIFGFAKSDRDSVARDEMLALRLVAAQWLDDPRKNELDVSAGILIEVTREQDA